MVYIIPAIFEQPCDEQKVYSDHEYWWVRPQGWGWPRFYCSWQWASEWVGESVDPHLTLEKERIAHTMPLQHTCEHETGKWFFLKIRGFETGFSESNQEWMGGISFIYRTYHIKQQWNTFLMFSLPWDDNVARHIIVRVAKMHHCWCIPNPIPDKAILQWFSYTRALLKSRMGQFILAYSNGALNP